MLNFIIHMNKKRLKMLPEVLKVKQQTPVHDIQIEFIGLLRKQTDVQISRGRYLKRLVILPRGKMRGDVSPTCITGLYMMNPSILLICLLVLILLLGLIHNCELDLCLGSVLLNTRRPQLVYFSQFWVNPQSHKTFFYSILSYQSGYSIE